MICPSCQKFCAFDTSNEPEVEIEVSEEGQITGSARIVLTSECCSEEMKESNFDIDIECGMDSAELEAHIKANQCELSVEADGAEITDRTESTKTRTLKSGKVVTRSIPYRYQRRFYGVSFNYTVTCSCEKDAVTWSGTHTDEVQASGMDEMV